MEFVIFSLSMAYISLYKRRYILSFPLGRGGLYYEEVDFSFNGVRFYLCIVGL